jgi:hypothetical protein
MPSSSAALREHFEYDARWVAERAPDEPAPTTPRAGGGTVAPCPDGSPR